MNTDSGNKVWIRANSYEQLSAGNIAYHKLKEQVLGLKIELEHALEAINTLIKGGNL